MPIPDKSDNFQTTQPTPASEEEKAAMDRALAKEESRDLFDRLEKENDASRSSADLNRRKRRP